MAQRKLAQTPLVCHGHTRPIVQLAYRCATISLDMASFSNPKSFIIKADAIVEALLVCAVQSLLMAIS